MRNELVTFTDPKSTVSEMFRSLRTNLQFMANSKKNQTILITSTLPGEGKSWTAANLAVTFAQARKKVVIVDCDLRKGRQFSVFNVVARPGVSNYISGVVNQDEIYDESNINNFIKETDVEGLYVIPAGDVPPNPSELLVSEKMNQMIQELKERFDIVIFDAPPAILVADAAIMSRMVDTTIIVVAYQETKKDNLNKVKRDIQNVGGNIAGVVINKIPLSVKKYQDSYYGEYYGKHSEMVPVKKNNDDLYLRGKAAILSDRDESKKNVEPQQTQKINNNLDTETRVSDLNEKMMKELEEATKESTTPTVSDTEKILKRMKEYVLEDKQKELT